MPKPLWKACLFVKVAFRDAIAEHTHHRIIPRKTDKKYCKKAIQNFNRALSKSSLQLDEHLRVLKCYIDAASSDVELMESLTASSVSLDPARYGLHLETGKFFGRQRFHAASARQYELYFQSMPVEDLVTDKNIRLLIHYVAKLHRLGQSETAEFWIRNAISIRDDHPTMHVELAYCLILLERPKEAISILRRVVEQDPKHTPAAFYLLRLLEGLSFEEKQQSESWNLHASLQGTLDSMLSSSLPSSCCSDSDLTCSNNIHGEPAASNCYTGFTVPSANWKITRLDFPTDLEFDDFVRKREPFIITGAGGHTNRKSFAKLGWKVEPWKNRQYLARTAGEEVVWIERKVGLLPFGFKSLKKETNFSFFLDLLETSSNEWYLNTQGQDGDYLSPPLTSLHQDLEFPPWLADRQLLTVNLWMGNAPNGSTSHLHHDNSDNLYLLIQGEKEFLIYSPADAFNLYPVGRIAHVSGNGSTTYIEQPSGWGSEYPNHFSLLPTQYNGTDAQHWAGLSQTMPAKVSLKEGEILYLPSGWWHQVTSYGPNLAVNFWWDP